MSGLARILTHQGGNVQGTDMVESQITESLVEDGISISFANSMTVSLLIPFKICWLLGVIKILFFTTTTTKIFY